MWSLASRVYLLICSEASEDSEFIYSYAQRPLKILSLFTHMLRGLSRFWVYLLLHSKASQDSEFTYPYTQRPLKILSLFTHTFWVHLLVLSKASWDSERIYSHTQRPLNLKTVKREPHRGELRHQGSYRQEWNKEYAQKWRRLFNLITVNKVSLSLTQEAWACCSGLHHSGKLPERLHHWA